MIRKMLMQRAVERTDTKLQEAIVAHARMVADRHYYWQIGKFYRDRAVSIRPDESAAQAWAYAAAMQKMEDNADDARRCQSRADELWAKVSALHGKLNELKGAL